jgi:hypothetical protein
MEQTLTINDQLVELGTLVDNQETSVQRVGARLIESYFNTFNDDEQPLDVEQAANILYYLTDIQVRDYALGLLDKDKSDRIIPALLRLVDAAPTDTIYINAPASLLSVAYYEMRNPSDSLTMLSNASEDYSLAILLRRVYTAGWDPSSFARMREELHPKVTASIFGEEE